MPVDLSPEPAKKPQPSQRPKLSQQNLLVANLAFLAVALISALIGYLLHDLRQHQAPATQQEQLELAEKAFQNSNDRVALMLFTRLADKNDPVAQYWLAHMTELGLGVPRDPDKALELYKKAAVQGLVPAETRLGEIFLDGNLVPPDYALARTYLEKAAYQGDARAAMLLGQMYRIGLGFSVDPSNAYTWLEVSTLEGNTFAQRERDISLRDLSPAGRDSAIARAKEILDEIKLRTAPPKKLNAK